MSFRFEVGPYQSAGPKKAQAFARSSRASQPRSHRSGSPFLPGSYRATSLRAGSGYAQHQGRALESTPGQLYRRRITAAMIRTQNRRCAVARRPLLSPGFIALSQRR